MIAEHRNARGVRDLCEDVLRRAEFLDAADRALLDQVLGHAVKPREVAVVAGRSTRTIQRRVALLCRRLTDPKVMYVLRHHHKWAKPMAQVGLAVWVRRWTLRRTAGHLGLSLHHVRRHVEAVRSLIQHDVAPPRRRPRRAASMTSPKPTARSGDAFIQSVRALAV